MHAPETHCSPAAQAWPQAPQWRVSLVVSTQAPLHSVWPEGQTHWPLAHVDPAGHVTPHAPQWRLSEPVLTQVPLQSV